MIHSRKKGLAAILAAVLVLSLSACGNSNEAEDGTQNPPASSAGALASGNTAGSDPQVQDGQAAGQDTATGWIAEQVLDGADGEIHYSCYLPEDYSEKQEYPLVVVMPGYDRMWFGEESSGSNLDWVGTLCWTELDEDLIVVSAQLTDWGERSARQAVELTEYFLENFPINPDRVYAAGYSAGGETMSQAVAMRPDLYAAYLHGASQWDGDFEPIAENGVAVYIFMADDVDAVTSPSVISPGNVQQLAGWVQEETGGDLFSIRVTDPYPSDWDDCLARANEERGNNARPELEENVANLDQYDTVFLGYPNWWYGVPMALLTFLEQNDLSGKQVYLFCSHGTGGLSNSVDIITEAAPNASVSDDIFDCYEEDASSSQDNIQSWVAGLGF